MAPLLFLDWGESTYNIGVVEESTVTTTSEQYWALRQAQVQTRIARFQTSTSMSSAEQDWKRFCARGATFLERLLVRACDRLEKPLRNYWNANKLLARDATRLFKADVVVELLIPFSRRPLRFVNLRSHSSSFEIRSLEIGDESHLYEIGRPYLAVSWRKVCLFAIKPSGKYVTMETFFLDTPDGARWSTDQVIPDVFAAVAKEFTTELDLVASQFAPLLEYWSAREHLEQEVHSLREINKSADAWNLI